MLTRIIIPLQWIGILIVSVALLASPPKVQASVMEDMHIASREAYNRLTAEKQMEIMMPFVDVPKEVVKLHGKLGGSVYLTGKMPEGHYAPGIYASGVKGSYDPGTHNINVLCTDNVETDILIHEFGHFLYCVTINEWREEDKENLQKLMELIHDNRCYNVEETFANTYAGIKTCKVNDKAYSCSNTVSPEKFDAIYGDIFRNAEKKACEMYSQIKDRQATGPAGY